MSSNFYCYCYCYPSMIIHRKPSSSPSASTASAKAKIETHASQPQQQKEHRNDDEDEKTRQGIFDQSKREEAAGSFDYTSTTTTIKGRSSTTTHDVSKREKSSNMTMRSESILSWLGVWGIVAVYLSLSKVMSSRSWRKLLTTCYSKLKKTSLVQKLCLLHGILWLVLLSTLSYQIVVHI